MGINVVYKKQYNGLWCEGLNGTPVYDDAKSDYRKTMRQCSCRKSDPAGLPKS